MKKILLVLSLLGLGACATGPTFPELEGKYTSNFCAKTYRQAQGQNIEDRLDRITDLYNNSCFLEVITLGSYLRENFRSKFYEVSSEVAEVVTPEGTFTTYVLESYERTYLSLVVSMSFLNLGKEEAALVELRRAENEENAYLYNHGADPVLSLLQAALWDRFDPAKARSHWKLISEISSTHVSYDLKLVDFAKTRLNEIDEEPAKKVRWQISGMGHMPDLDWSTQFLAGNSYKITPKTPFPASCTTADEALVPTSSWAQKIGDRYQSDYHPTLFAKSLLRIPAAVTYGVMGVTSGIAVGAAGCLLGMALKDHEGRICVGSVMLAGYMIQNSGNVVSYTLKPDLRHWSQVPSAFYISRLPATEASSCLNQGLSLVKTFHMIE